MRSKTSVSDRRTKIADETMNPRNDPLETDEAGKSIIWNDQLQRLSLGDGSQRLHISLSSAGVSSESEAGCSGHREGSS